MRVTDVKRRVCVTARTPHAEVECWEKEQSIVFLKSCHHSHDRWTRCVTFCHGGTKFHWCSIPECPIFREYQSKSKPDICSVVFTLFWNKESVILALLTAAFVTVKFTEAIVCQSASLINQQVCEIQPSFSFFSQHHASVFKSNQSLIFVVYPEIEREEEKNSFRCKKNFKAG